MANVTKAAETRLRETQAVFSDGAMVLTTPDGVLEGWDEDAERLLGFTADEAIGQSLQRLVIPAETTDELTARLASMCHDGHVQHLDSVWKAKNGAAMYVSVMISPIHGNEGKITAASIAVWDISGRKADETRLQLFRALLDKSSDAIEVIDQATLRYLDVNETACNTLGYTRNELLSMRVPDIDQDLSAPQWEKLDEDLQARQSMTIESFHRRKDGSKFPVEVNISLVQIGDLDFRIAVVRDTSKRKADEVNLKVFRALLDKAGDGIEVVDPVTLRFLDVNEAICRMHGYSREEMLLMHIPDLDPYIDKERLKEVNNTLQEKRSATLESLHRRKDGSTFPVEINISLIRILDRDYRLAMVRDITERRKSEEAQTLFRSLVDNSNDAIEVIEPDTMRFLDVNQTGCHQLGYSREELRSMTVRDIDTVSTVRDEAITEQMRTSGAARFETTHRRKDGSTFPVEVSVKRIELDRPYLLSIVRDISERKKMEVELRESEAAYRTLAHNLPGLVYRVSVREDGRMKFYNEMAAQMTGYTVDELTSGEICSIDPLIVDEDRPGILTEVRRAVAENRPFTVEYRLQHKNGGIRWMIEHGMPIRGADNEPLYIDGVIFDNTGHKLAEQIIQDERTFSDTLIQSLPDIFFLIDAGGTLLRWNRRFAELVSLPPEEISAAPPLAFVHEEDKPIVAQKIRQVLDSGSASVEARLTLSTGLRDYYLIGTRIETRLGANIIGIGIDITERKQAEEILRKRERQLEESQHLGHLGHWEWDAASNRGACSDEVYRIFGHEPGTVDVTMEGFLQSVYADDRAMVKAVIQKAVEAKEPTDADYRIVIPGGEVRWVHEKSTTLIGDDGTPTRVFGTLQDITERKQAESMLHDSEERLRAILDGALDGIALADVGTQQISSGNLSMSRMLGYSPEEMSRLRVEDIHPEQDLPYVFEQFGKQARGEIQIASDMPVKRKDGSVFYADINTSSVHFNGRDYLVGVFRDITERKQAEEELRRTNRALKLLSRCNTLLVRAEKEQPFLEEICRLAVETGGYMMAWIGIAENDPDKTVRPIAQSGYEEGYLDATKISWADTELGQGPTGTAIRTGKTEINPDCPNNPKMAPWREAILKRGYQSSIALPLIHRNRILGALTLYAAEPHAFYEEEVTLLHELANEISYGIENIRTRIKHEEQGAVLRQSLEQSIQAIADTVEARDPYTAGHQRNVADLAVAIAQELGLAEEQIHGIRLAATIHDLGKIHIPAEILSRPGKLTEIEYQMIKTHPQAGYDIIKGIEFPWPIAQMVLQHHERLDGSGYPQGLKGDQILPESMIIAVADVLEAMSSHRPYRGGLGLEIALDEIERNRGVYYDPATVDACIRLFRERGFSLPANAL